MITYSYTIAESPLTLMKMTRNWSLNQSPDVFCVNGRVLPSIFVIGIQKCGTTTLDGILSTYPQLSHGKTKEHHFFNRENLNFNKYIKEFPNCRKKLVRSYDATPQYTDPNTNSADNIKRFYNQLGIPLNQLIFIAIVCPNYLRLPSNFYFSRWNGYKIKNKKTKFNNWFEWILEHQDHDDSFDLLQKGFYNEIFAKYFDLFPESTFLLIDNQYAFKNLQKLNAFLAKELNLTKIKIPNIHRNKGHGKDEDLTEDNRKRLNQFYSKHEQNFIQILPLHKNVKLFPTNNFMRNGSWEF